MEICLNLRDEGDSTVILYSLEYTAREVRILDFSKVEVVQPILTGSKPNQDYLIRFFCNLNNLGFFD